MKLYKDYTKEPFSYLVSNITLINDNPLRFKNYQSYYKMTVSENIKTFNNKIEQNKAQYNLDRQTAKISVLSSTNVSKYEFLTNKDILPEDNYQKRLQQSKHSSIHY